MRREITGCAEGAFDLYHKGHVRLFQKMRDIFDKVLAVVNADEVVSSYKKTSPIIPFEDRVELLRSCKYVDEVIPAGTTNEPKTLYTYDSYKEVFPKRENFVAYLKTRPTIEWMERNDIDYMVQGRDIEKEYLDLWYEEPLKEGRIILLPETKDYHTTDIIKNILKK